VFFGEADVLSDAIRHKYTLGFTFSASAMTLEVEGRVSNVSVP